jgi:hypothetical protein
VDTPSGNGRTPVTAGQSVTAEQPAAASNGTAGAAAGATAGASNGHVPDPAGPVEVAPAEERETEESWSGLALAGEALSELSEPGQEVPDRVDETEPSLPSGEPAGDTPDAEPSPGTPAPPLATGAAAGSVDGERSKPAANHDRENDHDDDEQVDPAQAYRDRASYAPERYMIVQPHRSALLLEVVERLESVLRQRTPALADPQPAAPPRVSA